MNTNRLGILYFDKKDGFVFNIYERLGKADDGREILKELGEETDNNFSQLVGCKYNQLPLIEKYLKAGLNLYCFYEDNQIISRIRYISANLGDGFGESIIESMLNLEKYIELNEDVFAKNIAKVGLLTNLAIAQQDGGMEE